MLLSLALLTLYFRESSEGSLHEAQEIGLSVVTPFEIAGERVSRPFRNAWQWLEELLDAKEDNEALREELERLRQELVREQTASRENQELRGLLRYRDGPRFPEGFRAVAARVIARPPNPFAQSVVVAAGTDDGVRRGAPVVTEDGLVGIVAEAGSSASRVTLLTDQQSAVSAVVVQSGAPGVVRHGPSPSALVLDRVEKEALVRAGDTVVTAGWRSGGLESLYPAGIPIGRVTAVGQNDIDLYKRIQVTPLVDFDSLGSVLVLVEKRSP